MAKNRVLAVRRVEGIRHDNARESNRWTSSNKSRRSSEKDLGKAQIVEERKVEEDKWVFIEGCKNPKATTILVRGATQRVTDEAERSMHDALMVVKDVIEHPAIVVGGGAPEAELSYQLRDWANSSRDGNSSLSRNMLTRSNQFHWLSPTMRAWIRSILKSISEQNTVRGRSGTESMCLAAKCGDMEAEEVYEPTVVKEQIIKSATETACMILRIDDVIASSKTRAPPSPPPGGGGMGGMGDMD